MSGVIVPNNVPSVYSKPFRNNGKKDGLYKFSGGDAIGFHTEQFSCKKISAEDSKEFFLNIKSEPLSPKISDVSILNKEGVESNRLEEDDLLNIYIPISRINKNGAIVNTNFFNKNFLFTKKSNEIRMSGFYRKGYVYLSSFIIFGFNGEILEVTLPLEVNSQENSIIYIEANASIKVYQNEVSEFYFDGFSVYSGGSGEQYFQNYYYSLLDNEQDQDRTIDLKTKFPIGMVKDGNFITFCRGNLKLEPLVNEISYFAFEEDGVEIMRTDYTYSLNFKFV
jgi:hypothetical protein